jgi:hypothetical protein
LSAYVSAEDKFALTQLYKYCRHCNWVGRSEILENSVASEVATKGGTSRFQQSISGGRSCKLNALKQGREAS